jgi:hypothetical protein
MTKMYWYRWKKIEIFDKHWALLFLGPPWNARVEKLYRELPPLQNLSFLHKFFQCLVGHFLRSRIRITGYRNPEDFKYRQASIKDVQATKETFGPQKITSSTSKHEISKCFPIFVGHFALL